MTTTPTTQTDSLTDSEDAPARDAAATFVVGDGPTGRVVAARLAALGEPVTLLDPSPPTDPPPGHDVHAVDDTDAQSLRDAGLGDADAVVVCGSDDARNLMVAQHARSKFGVERVLVLVNDPQRRAAFDALGVESVDGAAATAGAVTDQW